MSDQLPDIYKDELSFPQKFIKETEDLARHTDDGDAWAKLMYGDWFVCPTSRLSDVFVISICRRKNYVAHGTDDSESLDVLVDSYGLGESSCDHGFDLPHISLRDIIFKSVEHLEDLDGVIQDADKPDAIKLLNDIEATVSSAIADLRLKISGLG